MTNSWKVSDSLSSQATLQVDLQPVRAAQEIWANTPVRARLRVLRAFRHDLASNAEEVAGAVPLDMPGQLHRMLADTLCSEVLPLAEGCRFLEREAERVLAPVKQSSRSRPLWLRGVQVQMRREPLGVILIIASGNYPLYLPGVQALQALAAGNAVLWKPAPGCAAPAKALREMLIGSGLDRRLLTVLEDSREAAQAAIEAGVDKVIVTGSASTGRAVLHRLADHLTPAVMELSGCDAVFVLAGADFGRVAEALAFGLRFNGSATCMAPRRLILTDAVAREFVPLLTARLRAIAPVSIPPQTHALMAELIDEATLFGARILLDGLQSSCGESVQAGVTLIDNAAPSMRIAQADLFAPVLSVLRASSEEHALELHRQCPYALTASVFGPRPSAQAFAHRIHAGVLLINDVVVSSADPRASFGGMGMSGFGATRGAAGLLEMTAAQSVVVQRSRSRRAWQPTHAEHAGFFVALLRLLHGKGWTHRLVAFRDLVRSARNLNS